MLGFTQLIKGSSIKKQLIVNYGGQLYVAILTLAIIPFYIKLYGHEQFGLIGISMAIYAGIAMLDLGVSSALTREATKYNSGAISHSYYLKIKKSFCLFFYVFGFLILFLLIINKESIAISWLSSSELPAEYLIDIVTAISVGTVFRWLTIYYRGILIGYEDIIWVSYLNTIGSTFRYLGVFPLFYFFSDNIFPYFCYQAVIILVELIVLHFRVRKLTVTSISAELKEENEAGFFVLIKFSLLSGSASFLWMGAIAFDKLTISTIVTLKEYSYYTLAIMMAGLISTIHTPLKNIIAPRLTSYFYSDAAAHREFFIKATTYSTIAFGVIAISIATFAQELIYIWTTDDVSAQNAQPYLSMYALGNGLAVLSSYVYYLQYSIGKLKQHLTNVFVFFLVFMVGFHLLTIKFGAIGAGYSWLLANIIYFLLAYTFAVRKILPQIWFSLFFRVVSTIVVMLAVSQLSAVFISIELKLDQLLLSIINTVLGFIITLISGLLVNYKIIYISIGNKKSIMSKG